MDPPRVSRFQVKSLVSGMLEIQKDRASFKRKTTRPFAQDALAVTAKTAQPRWKNRG
jgi:hypothetical protein